MTIIYKRSCNFRNSKDFVRLRRRQRGNNLNRNAEYSPINPVKINNLGCYDLFHALKPNNHWTIKWAGSRNFPACIQNVGSNTYLSQTVCTIKYICAKGHLENIPLYFYCAGGGGGGGIHTKFKVWMEIFQTHQKRKQLTTGLSISSFRWQGHFNFFMQWVFPFENL